MSEIVIMTLVIWAVAISIVAIAIYRLGRNE